jgi:hypothetical protein
VSIYPNQRVINNNYHLPLVITSNGEKALRVDSIKITGKYPKYYSLSGAPSFPALLPAINGELKLSVNFQPDTIANSLNSTLLIYSNDSTVTISLTGDGIGTAITLEETNDLFPQNPVVYPDFANMNKWQTITGASASGGTRLVGYIYNLSGDPTMPNKVGYVEYFPTIPTMPGKGPELDTFAVYAKMSVGSSNSSPRARYSIFPAGGGARVDSIINQNNQSSDLKFLGNHVFLRSDTRDAHAGTAINGYIRLENDTALVSEYYKDSVVNVAKRDTFVLRADAIILMEANIITGVAYEISPNVPVNYSLSQNYPNPFNPTTKIQFGLPVTENVQLRIYDVLGREVRSLLNERYDAGMYSVQWDGKNNFGRQVSSGMYIYHIRAGKFVQTKKMLLMK